MDREDEAHAGNTAPAGKAGNTSTDACVTRRTPRTGACVLLRMTPEQLAQLDAQREAGETRTDMIRDAIAHLVVTRSGQRADVAAQSVS